MVDKAFDRTNPALLSRTDLIPFTTSSAVPIVANTSGNAWLLNLDGEVGVIAPGKLADIVVWDSDPIADIAVLQRPAEILLIIKDGRIVDREAGGFLLPSEEPPRARMLVSG